MQPGNEYTLHGYGEMIADRVRLDAYRDALASTIKPGDIVLDLGAGCGILSLIACQLGAGKVYAVDPADALTIGAELAAANGFGRKIEFIQNASVDVSLEHKADVMVSDLRGVLPLHTAHIPSIIDARQRLLKKGGVQIPRRDWIRLQPVSSEDLWGKGLGIWRNGVYGLDLSPMMRWAAHEWRKADFSKARLLAAPQCVFEIDYSAVESPDAQGELLWRFDTAETLHGFAAWFDTELSHGKGFSNAPDQPPAIYGQAFFPFLEPLRVPAGGQLGVGFSATKVGGDYVWRWDTTLRGQDGRTTKSLAQSSFHAMPLSPQSLRKHAAAQAPLVGQGK